MLRVGTGFAPDNRARGQCNEIARAANAFAIRFHIQLLNIGGKSFQALVIGNQATVWQPMAFLRQMPTNANRIGKFSAGGAVLK